MWCAAVCLHSARLRVRSRDRRRTRTVKAWERAWALALSPSRAVRLPGAACRVFGVRFLCSSAPASGSSRRRRAVSRREARALSLSLSVSLGVWRVEGRDPYVTVQTGCPGRVGAQERGVSTILVQYSCSALLCAHSFTLVHIFDDLGRYYLQTALFKAACGSDLSYLESTDYVTAQSYLTSSTYSVAPSRCRPASYLRGE